MSDNQQKDPIPVLNDIPVPILVKAARINGYQGGPRGEGVTSWLSEAGTLVAQKVFSAATKDNEEFQGLLAGVEKHGAVTDSERNLLMNVLLHGKLSIEGALTLLKNRTDALNSGEGELRQDVIGEEVPQQEGGDRKPKQGQGI